MGRAGHNAEASRALERAGVLADAGPMIAAVGLRNVLVHGYAEVDDDLVRAALSDLTRVEAYVADVSRWLLAQDRRCRAHETHVNRSRQPPDPGLRLCTEQRD